MTTKSITITATMGTTMVDPVTISRNCPGCEKQLTVVVEAHDLLAWRNGEKIQRAFPYLSADEREILLSGYCPECWDRVTKPPDE